MNRRSLLLTVEQSGSDVTSHFDYAMIVTYILFEAVRDLRAIQIVRQRKTKE
jgi:hypothetical protein